MKCLIASYFSAWHLAALFIPMLTDVYFFGDYGKKEYGRNEGAFWVPPLGFSLMLLIFMPFVEKWHSKLVQLRLREAMKIRVVPHIATALEM